MAGIITDTDNTKEVLNRLSASAFSGEGEQCQVDKSDLSTILLAYTLEINKNKAQRNKL